MGPRGFPMKVIWLAVLLVLHFTMVAGASTPNHESSDLTDAEVQLLYGLFKDIKNFGLISVSLIGDAQKIGLNEFQLTQLMDNKFRSTFCNIEYKDLTQTPEKLAAAIGQRDKQIGLITFRVWVMGTDYPLAYHVRCDAGSFANPSIWTEEVLGHGSNRTAPAAIQEIMTELMRQLAVNFLKARGEKCRRGS
jgi:hypothetical protein